MRGSNASCNGDCEVKRGSCRLCVNWGENWVERWQMNELKGVNEGDSGRSLRAKGSLCIGSNMCTE